MRQMRLSFRSSCLVQEKHESVDSDNALVCRVSCKTSHTHTLLQGRTHEHKKAHYLQQKEERRTVRRAITARVMCLTKISPVFQ